MFVGFRPLLAFHTHFVRDIFRPSLAEYPVYCKAAWGQDLAAEEEDASLRAIGGNTKSG